MIAALALGYALSPVGLIPVFILVPGYLDDLIPPGIALALRMIPAEVLRDCRLRAGETGAGGASGRPGLAVVILLWLTPAIVAAFGVFL